MSFEIVYRNYRGKRGQTRKLYRPFTNQIGATEKFTLRRRRSYWIEFTKNGASPMMQNAALLNLDHAHCRAICDEIGERLGFILKPASSDIPPRLLYLIARLAELDNSTLPRLESAPSIAPSAEDMADAIADFTADAA